MQSLLESVLSPGLFTESFMQHAWLSGTIIAILSGAVGFFAMLRGTAFAAHALPKIGFAGAAGAVWLNVNPLLGLTTFATLGAALIGALGKTMRHDVVVGLLLAFALGTGALFLTFNDEYAAGAISLLFGQIVGVSASQVWDTLYLGIACLLLLSLLFRPLLYSTITPEAAEARGISLRLVDILFLIIIGITTAVTVPIVGALLAFSLLIGPAATAHYLAHRPLYSLFWSIGAALAIVWIGIVLAYDTGWPIGFFVASLSVLWYIVGRTIRATLSHRQSRTTAKTSYV